MVVLACIAWANWAPKAAAEPGSSSEQSFPAPGAEDVSTGVIGYAAHGSSPPAPELETSVEMDFLEEFGPDDAASAAAPSPRTEFESLSSNSETEFYQEQAPTQEFLFKSESHIAQQLPSPSQEPQTQNAEEAPGSELELLFGQDTVPDEILSSPVGTPLPASIPAVDQPLSPNSTGEPQDATSLSLEKVTVPVQQNSLPPPKATSGGSAQGSSVGEGQQGEDDTETKANGSSGLSSAATATVSFIVIAIAGAVVILVYRAHAKSMRRRTRGGWREFGTELNEFDERP